VAVLFSGLQVTVGGVQSQAVIAVASGSRIRLTMDASVFPVGTTTISIGISTDGGVTYKSASMGCIGGVGANGAHNYVMTYEREPGATITHTKVTVDSLVGFSANTVIEAL